MGGKSTILQIVPEAPESDLLALQVLDKTLDFDRLILCAVDESEAGNLALRRRTIFGECVHGGQGDVGVKDGLAICVVAGNDAASSWERWGWHLDGFGVWSCA